MDMIATTTHDPEPTTAQPGRGLLRVNGRALTLVDDVPQRLFGHAQPARRLRLTDLFGKLRQHLSPLLSQRHELALRRLYGR